MPLLIEQYISGKQPVPGQWIYSEIANWMKAIVADYVYRPLLDYLRGIAHNFNLQYIIIGF